MTISCKRPFLCALGALSVLASSNVVSQSTPITGANSQSSSVVIRRPSPLVDKVRAATQRFQDIKVAIDEGWVQGTPCVSGPNSGAMGVHYVLPDRIGDGKLDGSQPEALIYEPLSGGQVRLVGVEFIVLVEDWNTQNPNTPPTLDGHLLNLVPEPNRYRLPAFYELHVWAWEDNPNGSFADWNTLVSCDLQPAS
jgi:hypothetical protein